jgi:hypothetical protein
MATTRLGITIRPSKKSIYIMIVSTNYHLNQSIEELININPIDYAWEYKRYQKTSSPVDDPYVRHLAYFCQKIGMNKTKKVNISSLPNIIANDNIPLPTLIDSEPYVCATSPRPGPKII